MINETTKTNTQTRSITTKTKSSNHHQEQQRTHHSKPVKETKLKHKIKQQSRQSNTHINNNQYTQTKAGNRYNREINTKPYQQESAQYTTKT